MPKPVPFVLNEACGGGGEREGKRWTKGKRKVDVY